MKKILKKIGLWIWKATLWFLAISILSVFVFKWVPIPWTPLMTTRAVENFFNGEDMICSHDWEPIGNISVHLQKAVIASEDATFLKHRGFDFNAIEKAMKSNEKGRKLRGGSTISQQTAKNVFLWQGRSYVRKALEAYFTLLIEVVWGKERIMEVYLNSIEMGNGVYGAEAASKYWYRKNAVGLTRREAAGIAAILPNPRKFTATNSTARINRKKERIMAGMVAIKTLDY